MLDNRPEFFDDREPEQARRRKFVRSLVFFGGALGVSCGAVTEGGPREGAGGDALGTGGEPESGAGGSGGTIVAVTGGSTSTGGQLGQTGGKLIVDPDIPVFQWPDYGTGALGGAAGAFGIFECPPAQWDCDIEAPFCNGRRLVDESACSCDVSRPREAADCAEGEQFVCDAATIDTPRGTESVAVDCECIAAEPSCDPCQEGRGPGTFVTCDIEQEEGRVLCSCAYVLLK